MIRVFLADMQQEFQRVGFVLCAHIFAETSLDGVASHEVNCFATFIEQIRKDKS